MNTFKIVCFVVITFLVVASLYFVFQSKTKNTPSSENEPLPVCQYGPTDAVLNAPCKRGKFGP